MPELKQRIVEDMKSAMKAKDKEGLKEAPDSAIALSTTLVMSFSESCAGI
jgi:hypothetical protein